MVKIGKKSHGKEILARKGEYLQSYFEMFTDKNEHMDFMFFLTNQNRLYLVTLLNIK